MTVTIIDESPRFRLGRHIEHDPRSRAYALDDALAEHFNDGLGSVSWENHTGILDQRQLGACVGFATAESCGTGRNFDALDVIRRNSLVADGYSRGIEFYRQATQLDNIPGEYPPTDTGSSGIGGAKAAQKMGYISGYLHAFTLAAALKALQLGPIICGTNWYEGMFDTTNVGEVQISGQVSGGHEWMAYGYDAPTGHILAQQSWGDWGLRGRFWVTTATFERLLGEKGDVTSFVPLSLPAPVPTPPDKPVPVPPVPSDDLKLWTAMQAWAVAKGLK
jgi:hypothetical protein